MTSPGAAADSADEIDAGAEIVLLHVTPGAVGAGVGAGATVVLVVGGIDVGASVVVVGACVVVGAGFVVVVVTTCFTVAMVVVVRGA